MACCLSVCAVNVHQLAAIVRNRIDNVLILDSRSFLEYNSSHVVNAINVGCAKLMKRRLQQEKLSIQDFLAQNCHCDVESSMDIIVYDQNSNDSNCLLPDTFMAVFLQKLLPVYHSVNILKGGFTEFQASYPNLCASEKTKFTPLTSLSQPCLPISNHGPTRILPFLYLGSQHDALNTEVLQNYNITYELNVSTNCPKPDFIKDSHFLRIPVIDNYSEMLLPHFAKAFQFLDKVKESGGCVLVHCLAGISRSATVAIAYVMKTLKMSSDEAYRYVKAKRTTISPNFNFLGQLLEFEKQLKHEASVTVLPMLKELNSKSSRYSSSSFSHTASNVTFNSYSSFTSERYKKSDIACVPEGHQVTTFNVKCLPVSALKQLNFTPCQTSIQCAQKSVVRNGSSHKENGNKPVTRNVFESSKMDSVMSFGSLSPELRELKSFDFDKSFARSDSLSTSGIGSEGSECTDSWNDYPAEKETDILMDDDYGTVPAQEDEFCRAKALGFEDSYEEPLSLYPKYDPNYDGGNDRLGQLFRNCSCGENDQQTMLHKNPKFPSNRNCLASAQCEAAEKDLGKAHLLYRAQSCPGMLSSESSQSPVLVKAGTVALRKSRSKNSEKERYLNRYSCSSLDYMEYSASSDVPNVSCPDDELNVSAVAANSSPTRHRNFRHSLIQVS